MLNAELWLLLFIPQFRNQHFTFRTCGTHRTQHTVLKKLRKIGAFLRSTRTRVLVILRNTLRWAYRLS